MWKNDKTSFLPLKKGDVFIFYQLYYTYIVGVVTSLWILLSFWLVGWSDGWYTGRFINYFQIAFNIILSWCYLTRPPCSPLKHLLFIFQSEVTPLIGWSSICVCKKSKVTKVSPKEIHEFTLKSLVRCKKRKDIVYVLLRTTKWQKRIDRRWSSSFIYPFVIRKLSFCDPILYLSFCYPFSLFQLRSKRTKYTQRVRCDWKDMVSMI